MSVARDGGRGGVGRSALVAASGLAGSALVAQNGPTLVHVSGGVASVPQWLLRGRTIIGPRLSHVGGTNRPALRFRALVPTPLPRGNRARRVAQHRWWQTGKQPSNTPINADLPNRGESKKRSVCAALVQSSKEFGRRVMGNPLGGLLRYCYLC